MIKFKKVINIPTSFSEEGVYFVNKGVNNLDNGIYIVSTFSISGQPPAKHVVPLSQSLEIDIVEELGNDSNKVISQKKITELFNQIMLTDFSTTSGILYTNINGVFVEL